MLPDGASLSHAATSGSGVGTSGSADSPEAKDAVRGFLSAASPPPTLPPGAASPPPITGQAFSYHQQQPPRPQPTGFSPPAIGKFPPSSSSSSSSSSGSNNPSQPTASGGDAANVRPAATAAAAASQPASAAKVVTSPAPVPAVAQSKPATAPAAKPPPPRLPPAPKAKGAPRQGRSAFDSFLVWVNVLLSLGIACTVVGVGLMAYVLQHPEDEVAAAYKNVLVSAVSAVEPLFQVRSFLVLRHMRWPGDDDLLFRPPPRLPPRATKASAAWGVFWSATRAPLTSHPCLWATALGRCPASQPSCPKWILGPWAQGSAASASRYVSYQGDKKGKGGDKSGAIGGSRMACC